MYLNHSCGLFRSEIANLILPQNLPDAHPVDV
jgi:hypothetical protein